MKVNDGVRRTQAERSAHTRAQLVNAARELFSSSGFHAVSTQQVVAAAGVTRGALYHQFVDKNELFSAVFEAVEQELVADVGAAMAAAAPGDAVSAMRLGARLFLDRCAVPATAQIILIDAPAVLGWQRWRELGGQYGLGVIEEMLAGAIRAGAIPDQPVRPTAHVVLSALDEAALYISRAANAEEARAEMYAVCDRLIDGIALPARG